MTLSSQVNTSLHQGIAPELISATVHKGRRVCLQYRSSEEESLRLFWRTRVTHRGGLVLNVLGCFSQVLGSSGWLSGLSEGEWGNYADGVPGRPNALDWRGLRDSNGEPAGPITPHLKVGLSCGHVEVLWGELWGVDEIQIKKGDPAFKISEHSGQQINFLPDITDISVSISTDS